MGLLFSVATGPRGYATPLDWIVDGGEGNSPGYSPKELSRKDDDDNRLLFEMQGP
ncbi:hypothetical protein CC1G_13985 [Coprinopsis cinerea okayama7|uniref:Uncharacterized protein n=1 Tax=Coprinopsis cinerea (strain Okayama-7 / 130 / ATCC MYA-4618 / FGSC 9003) TaxID=240176 RepID=D6RKZ2_COPC7|nr:hypothetical protein CC1G_13985 [Coprinopsis cinerea okayama7\|eukprot:XP_002911946.1 hypothetical protein CC1G_13985 [Coprinopsis cinerea okayama7\